MEGVQDPADLGGGLGEEGVGVPDQAVETGAPADPDGELAGQLEATGAVEAEVGRDAARQNSSHPLRHSLSGRSRSAVSEYQAIEPSANSALQLFSYTP